MLSSIINTLIVNISSNSAAMLSFIMAQGLKIPYTDIWDVFIKQGPLIVLFLIITVYLGWQLYKKDKEIIQLNKYIRDSDKENLSVLNEVNNTLTRVLDNQKTSSDDIKDLTKLETMLTQMMDNQKNLSDGQSKEISNLKEYINLKFK